MNRSARILTMALSGLMASPLAAADGSEQSTAGPPAPAAEASAPPRPTGAHAVLRPYYVVPFFPFLLPVPPGHPATAPAQALPPQSFPFPAYPFVIWLPVQQPAMLPAPVAAREPAAVKPSAGLPLIEPPIATIQPIPPQALATETAPNMQEAVGPLTVSKAFPQPGVEPDPLPKGPESASETPIVAEPAAESVVVREARPKESARYGLSPATKPLPATTGPGGAAKPAQKGSRGKRRLCWKDGMLDVCK